MTQGKSHWLLPESPYSSYESYLRQNGPSAVLKARAITPTMVLSEIKRSGLRGRGGAGFPTGTKWQTLHQHPCKKRFVVCNAAEGEPGTFKDRWLMRQNPYALLEGMLIAAHAIRTKNLYIGIKASFTQELTRLRQAMDELTQAGLLKDMTVNIVEGPEDYLFGEEKALLNFIEERLPLPREPQYPPYEKGLFATPDSPNPALVNNVETFAHVSSILRLGPVSFRRLGSADTSGTILFTLSGDIQRPGVYEKEAGITLRDLLFEVAGGPKGKPIKIVLSGVSAPGITPEQFDTPCDFGSLAKIGGGLGSAGFIFYDESRSIPRLAQMVARFLYVESCNQCTACKFGLRTASSAIDEVFDPERASSEDPERALYGARSAPQGNRCYLPVQGSLLIPYLLQKFAGEFDEQIRHPDSPAQPIPVPLLRDYDASQKRFTLDGKIAQKSPDWNDAPAREIAN